MRVPVAVLAVVAITSSVVAADQGAGPGKNAPPVDFSGMWMVTSTAPDGKPAAGWPVKLPFLPGAQAAVDAYQKSYNDAVDDPLRDCLPYGMPRQMAMTARYPMELIQQPQQLTMLFELHFDVRRIYLDGRAHPENLQPMPFGHSVGRWEGTTLVVDTVGLRAAGPPQPKSPYTRIIERMRLVAGGARGEMLEDRVQVEDAKTYGQPVTFTAYYTRVPDTEMNEYFCTEDLWHQALTGDTSTYPWR